MKKASALIWSRWMLALFVFSAFLVVACGDDDDDDDGNGSDPTATTAPGGDGGDGPRTGGEITIQYVEFASFDPHFSSFSQDIGHQGFVFRGLYRLDAENNVLPEMAAGDPEISDDGLTVTIPIQEGLVWSDGDDLTAEDFVLGLLRTCNPDNAGEYQYVLTNLVGCDDYYTATEASDAEKDTLRDAVGVRAVDATTVEISLIQQQPTFPILLALWMTWPVPAHLLPDPGQAWPTSPTDLVFNGPFVVESHTAGQQIVFVRNDNYAGDHLAYLDKITLRYIEDNLVSNNAYRGGELDMALADTTNLSGLQTEFPDDLVSVGTASTIGLELQMEVPPLDNFDVRLALSRAIDRQTLNDVVLQGAHVPTTTWVPPDISGVEPDVWDDIIGFNPEEARAALESAGYPNGEGFPELTILIRDSAGNIATAEFLQASFSEHLNIDVAIEIVDAPTRSSRFTNEQFELFPGGWIQDYPDPENWIIGLFDTDGGLNHYNCSDPDIDALVASAQFNPDNDERLSQYREANELISTRLCGIAVMYHQGHHDLVSPQLRGAREFSNALNRVAAGDWIPEEWWLEE